jgi:hypothetical protein
MLLLNRGESLTKTPGHTDHMVPVNENKPWKHARIRVKMYKKGLLELQESAHLNSATEGHLPVACGIQHYIVKLVVRSPLQDRLRRLWDTTLYP